MPRPDHLRARTDRWAIAYAERGWFVVPCWSVRDDGSCACPKAGCEAAGKHPITALCPRGWKDASNDPRIVASWWKQYQDANVGIALEQSGFCVVDADRHGSADGVAQLEAMTRQALDAIRTPQAATGGGGLHLVFRRPSGELPKMLAPGLELLRRQLIVVAPSLHKKGGVYAWRDGYSPWDYDPLPLPDYLTPPSKPAPQRPANPVTPPVWRPGQPGDRMALGALNDACEQISRTPEGGRNVTSFKLAAWPGEYVGAGRLDEHVATTRLIAACVAAGLSEDEATSVVKNGIDKGKANPRWPEPSAPADTKPSRNGASRQEPQTARRRQPAPVAGGTRLDDQAHDLDAPTDDDLAADAAWRNGQDTIGEGEPAVTGTVTPILAAVPAPDGADADDDVQTRFWRKSQDGKRDIFTPSAVGAHLATHYPVARGGQLLWVYRDGAYQPDGEDVVRELVRDLLGKAWQPQYADAVVKWLRAGAPKLWETPPLDKIHCQNGILDLTTSELADHSAAFLWPIRIGAAYQPGATCPTIDAFLAQVLPADCISQFWEWAGYLLVPDNRYQKAVMLLGAGENGKSKLIALLVALVGRANTSSVALHQLVDDRFAVAELYGKLLNTFADLDARALKSTSMFKAVVGGDLITGERKFRDAFTFGPYARLMFSANTPPPTPDASNAFFRRWTIWPCEATFTGATRDPDIVAKLTTDRELSGALNQALAGLHRLRDRAEFLVPESSRVAADRFAIDSDSAAGFREARCEWSPLATTAKPALYKQYRAWCEDNGRAPLSSIHFNQRLVSLSGTPSRLEIKASNGTDFWIGIRMIDE
jgi:P4 family phage/plasmid primase-like protien